MMDAIDGVLDEMRINMLDFGDCVDGYGQELPTTALAEIKALRSRECDQ